LPAEALAQEGPRPSFGAIPRGTDRQRIGGPR